MAQLASLPLRLESRAEGCGLGAVDARVPAIPECLRHICPAILYMAGFYGATFLMGGRLGWLRNANMVTFQCMAGKTACDLEFVDRTLRLRQYALSGCEYGYGEAEAVLESSCGPCGAWIVTAPSSFCTQVLFRAFPHLVASLSGLLDRDILLGCGQTQSPTQCLITSSAPQK